MSSYKKRPKRPTPSLAMKAKAEMVNVNSVNLPPPAGNIFAKWLKVITRPRVVTFASEMPAASWASIALGAALYALGYFLILFIGVAVLGKSPFDLIIPIVEFTAANLASTLIALFFASGFVFLLSRMGEGSGDFRTQTYLYSLYSFPLAIVGSLLGFIPGLGTGIPAIAVAIYELFLTYYMVQAAHRLSPGDAARVVILTLLAQIVITLILTFTVLAVVLNSVHLGV